MSMSVINVATTAVPRSASLSSTVPLTSARVTSTSFSTPSAIIVTSSNDNRSTTASMETSFQPTTAVPSTIQSTLTSSLSTFVLSVSTSSTPTSVPTSTSNAPFVTIFSPSPPSTPSQGSAGRTETPLTTVLESTTIFITSTNGQGQLITGIPLVVTEVITTTGSGGMVTTVTQAIVNPTLAPNNGTTENSSFFANTGTVVGVFVVVGLASASIMIWILFAIRHRQRMKRIKQDTAVEAAVAAAGLNRAPLEDGDEGDSAASPNTRPFTSWMVQRSSLCLGGSSSLPTSARLFEASESIMKDGASSHPEWPVEHRADNHPVGYIMARGTGPSPRTEQCTDDVGSSRDRKSSYGHTTTYSACSFEPLLANYARNTPDQESPVLIMQPPRKRSPQRLEGELVSSGYSSDGGPEAGSRTSSKRQSSSDNSVLVDEEDYTHYVLTVRNVTDDQSRNSL